MFLISHAEYITVPQDIGENVPCFLKGFALRGPVLSAQLQISALGVYEAILNGQRVGDFIFAPGWTEYDARLQFQTYDVTPLLEKENTLSVMVGQGWYAGNIRRMHTGEGAIKTALIAALTITYQDGHVEHLLTDDSWRVMTTPILLSSYYDGETVDMNAPTQDLGPAALFPHNHDILIPQEGEEVHAGTTFAVQSELNTPKGERVLDFGQNLTGYVRIHAKGKKGDVVELSFAEVLDKDGNFYTENMRSAKNKIVLTLGQEPEMDYTPTFSFQGFRYVRLDQCPAGMTNADFTAVAIHSVLEQTGSFACEVPLVNQLFHNILWGQRSNFLDVPTDCPQRDERLGWTGDAQVFARTASYNFRVDRFFTKWLHDLNASQDAQGRVPHVIPNVLGKDSVASAAWADVATIAPWEMYLTYGQEHFLTDQFDSAKKWVDYQHAAGPEEFLWLGGEHFGDWLGLDAPEGSYKGSTDDDLIASAFFAHSTALLIRMGQALGIDMAEYEALLTNIKRAWNQRYVTGERLTCDTQTAYVLALAFDLVPNKAPFAARLTEKIHENGDHLQTGFVGTPYLLCALSDNGYTDLAYTLLLQKDYPSWLYPITKGATTMWEHWDGLKPDGSMWSSDMNSFNHYAYGAVGQWLYNVCAGINPDPNNPGFKHILFLPHPDARMGSVSASIRTARGLVASSWRMDADGRTHYSFTVPQDSTATAFVEGKLHFLPAGTHIF